MPRAKKNIPTVPVAAYDWVPEIEKIEPTAELAAMASALCDEQAEKVLDRHPIPATTHLSRMSPAEKLLREQFVVEYFYDRDAFAACCRLGYPPGKAREIGWKLENEPAVQRLIREREKEFSDAHEITLSRIAGMYLREIADRGVTSSQSARIAAIGALAKLTGVAKPEEVNVNIQGGVMEVLPVAVDAEWEVASESSQRKLLEDVRK